jgi:hypothetical protein
LARRYSPGEHGLQLVFPRAEVERWSAAHGRRRRVARGSGALASSGHGC